MFCFRIFKAVVPIVCDMQYPNETDLLGTTSAAADSSGDIPGYLGYVSCVIAILFFGSNFVPVKKFETGDGKF